MKWDDRDGRAKVASGSFGARLRWWRERRGLSQLDLAGAAETTQRHLSFLESGRATPSREMILRLAAVLGLPLRQQNAVFLAAGYAPPWRESDLSAPELVRVSSALDLMLTQQALTPETRGLIGRPQLEAMKSRAVVVNVSRAEIVDEAALYHALAEGRLAGAALDVWYRYPTSTAPTLPAHQPFHELPNVLMTPHVSGWTEGMLEARARLIAENIRRAARGEPPVNEIAPAA